MIRKLAYPTRYFDLMRTFGRGEAELSSIFNTTLQIITTRWLPLLQGRNICFSPERILMYAEAVNWKLGAVVNTIGFIDTQFVACAVPTIFPDSLYNGYEKANGWKYQDLDHPDGLSGYCYGPIEGRGADSRVLGESGILPFLNTVLAAVPPPPPPAPAYAMFGDKGYPIRARLSSPFRGRGLTALQEHFNTMFATVRIAVEWGFGKIGLPVWWTQFQAAAALPPLSPWPHVPCCHSAPQLSHLPLSGSDLYLLSLCTTFTPGLSAHLLECARACLSHLRPPIAPAPVHCARTCPSRPRPPAALAPAPARRARARPSRLRPPITPAPAHRARARPSRPCPPIAPAPACRARARASPAPARRAHARPSRPRPPIARARPSRPRPPIAPRPPVAPAPAHRTRARTHPSRPRPPITPMPAHRTRACPSRPRLYLLLFNLAPAPAPVTHFLLHTAVFFFYFFLF